ncbi:MAG: STAS domain-containing protein [Gammaproteobacteria bacterium]|nr:STAS domain-containing protein [Gammaproteobacteria bacterium]
MSSDQAAKTIIACESTVDIKIAADLHMHLKNAIDNKHAVEIDAKEVQRIDTAILQIILAYVLEAKAQDLQVSWQGVSDAVYAAAGLLGISEALGLPEAA